MRYLPSQRTDRPDPAAIEPARSTEIEPSGEVIAIEAELVSDEDYRQLQKRKAIERYKGYGHDVVVAATWTKRVATHDRTKTTGKFLMRNAIYVGQGAGVLVKRVWEAKTNSRYERQMRSAEAGGNQELLQEWETRAEQARQRRHDRAMDWLQSPGTWPRPSRSRARRCSGCCSRSGSCSRSPQVTRSRILGPIESVLNLIAWTAWAFAHRLGTCCAARRPAPPCSTCVHIGPQTSRPSRPGSRRADAGRRPRGAAG